MPQPRTSISPGNLISARGGASGLSKLSLTSRKRIGRIRGSTLTHALYHGSPLSGLDSRRYIHSFVSED